MTANTPSSRKAKGRVLQNKVRERILEQFSGYLEDDDILTAVMGEAGEDLKLSPKARKHFPYSVECKNQEKLNIWSALEQAEANTKPGSNPLLVFKRNHSETYMAMKFDDFLSLISLAIPEIEEFISLEGDSEGVDD